MPFRKRKENKYKTADSDSKFKIFKPKYRLTKKAKKGDRDLPEVCRFCVNSHSLFDSDTMLCDSKGVVGCNYSCRKFAYDPLKHIPLQSPSLNGSAGFFPLLDDDIDDIPAAPSADGMINIAEIKEIHTGKEVPEEDDKSVNSEKDNITA